MDVPNAWYGRQQPLLWAYAGGGGLRRYGNAAEDIEESIRRGFKVIEIDFARTSDGVPVASHFFKPEDDDREWDHVPTVNEFKSKSVNGKYTPLTFEDVTARYCHSDVFVSLDPFYYVCNVKNGESEFRRYAVAHSSADERARMILQVYSFKALVALRGSHDFGALHYVFGGGLQGNSWRVRHLIPLLTEAGVRSVSFQDTVMTPEVVAEIRRLHDANIRVSVAGVNTIDRYREVRAVGVDCVNTMGLSPEDVRAYGESAERNER